MSYIIWFLNLNQFFSVNNRPNPAPKYLNLRIYTNGFGDGTAAQVAEAESVPARIQWFWVRNAERGCFLSWVTRNGVQFA